MTISFRKIAGKPSVLSVIRDDGSSCWTKIQPGLEAHDLAHYAVESVLKFDDAFYGLLNRGFTVEDFELPRAQRPHALLPTNLPAAALQTEHFVNLLTTELAQGMPLDNFSSRLNAILTDASLPTFTELTETKLASIRTILLRLVTDWRALPAGEKMVLDLSFATA